MQKWEYKFVELNFGAPGKWKWSEDWKQLPGEPDILAKAKELGQHGWELVGVAPREWYHSFWFKRPAPEGVPPPLPKG